LAISDVVMLIFTTESEDWSYCMWECGVATDPDCQDVFVTADGTMGGAVVGWVTNTIFMT